MTRQARRRLQRNIQQISGGNEMEQNEIQQISQQMTNEHASHLQQAHVRSRRLKQLEDELAREREAIESHKKRAEEIDFEAAALDRLMQRRQLLAQQAEQAPANGQVEAPEEVTA